ncbi:hypothetical protein POJ06DRAFT_234683 [Lipomyces tetrasporus]|uniref:Uncharacterized protein n=1 Tax=Lipomyces tetrasporus TaxID=54092 RepID=A0AAD7QYG5_9ASCO|nr:uncharacterized protein POJ06DRAFT_234683 [Lipomyces tetrasporus]KAJ8103695.1 hypothetical protein POJ06DRAFT_234683 [Lipomyces tetrasporus]
MTFRVLASPQGSQAIKDIEKDSLNRHEPGRSLCFILRFYNCSLARVVLWNALWNARNGPSPSGSSSTPSPYSASGPLRKRRRVHNDMVEKEPSKGGSFQLMEQVMTQLARSLRNVLQQAINLLEEEYGGKLSGEHMDMALDCLESEAKSSVFTGIKDVARRDRWVQGSGLHRQLNDSSIA